MKIQLLNGARPTPRIGGRGRSRLLLALTLLLTGCASSVTAAWPKPALTYTHAATAKQASARVTDWQASGPGRRFGDAALTGSMLPYIHGGPREILLLEEYAGQPIALGHVVSFARDAKTPRCLHMVAAIRGDMLYLSGTNNRHSDGWYHRSAVAFILREIVTLPALNPSNSVSQ